MSSASLHLAVALDGAGFHPASWRDPSARPAELFTPAYWIDLARTAERGLLDLITIEDSFGLQSSNRRVLDGRTDQVRGRLDAVMIASLMAPRTTHLGLVPTANTTHTEPFHLASAFSTLDWVSQGRAGWRPQVSGNQHEADHVGRRQFPRIDPTRRDDPAATAFMRDLFEEATDAVDVVRRLWDSWEDDAVIRDTATGRFVDRDKLHYVDFEGRFFSVKGPSIVPRPPQGNPLVVALAHSQVPFEFAARSADVVFVTPADTGDVGRWVQDIRLAETAVGRRGEPVRVLADLVVFLDETTAGAAARKDRLDELDGRSYRSDAAVFVGTPDDLVDELLAWRSEGVDGFRLRPAVIGHDLDQIVEAVVPRLQQRGVFRTEYADELLRERFGLAHRPSRYVRSEAAS
jgi:alkanesulfonate monooxygenase SsuD/methylene tetrahydromethanopterin reductase-like flavin-dependent oxidoreductase (luciferase family)